MMNNMMLKQVINKIIEKIIYRPDSKLVELSKLNAGEVFVYDQDLYMRTFSIRENGTILCVELISGSDEWLDSDIHVLINNYLDYTED